MSRGLGKYSDYVWGTGNDQLRKISRFTHDGGRSKVSTFKDLQEKVSKRAMGWKEKNILKAGREFLIKTVA